MRIYKIVGIVLSAMLLLASCTNSDLEKKKVKIAYANWLEGIAMSHLAKVVLEEHGYEVELQNADLAPIFVSMSGKKSDVFLDAWLPITMKDYMDQYGDSIEFLGEVYGEARVGLVVPQYVTIQSINELEANKDRFSSEIVGIDAGAGIMKTTDKAIAAYGLDGYTLMTSSSSTMLASLKKAMDKGEWIVITGWTPHWMFDQFDLKFLDDPKKVYGDLEEIHAIAWKGFSEKDPFAAEFFGNIKLTTEELSSFMTAMKDARMDEEEIARKWRDEHRLLVDSWILNFKYKIDMNSSGKKVVLFMLDRVHTIKNGNLLQDYRFLFIGYYYYSAPQFSLAKRL